MVFQSQLCNPSTQRQRQEAKKLQVILSYRASLRSPCLKERKGDALIISHHNAPLKPTEQMQRTPTPTDTQGAGMQTQAVKYSTTDLYQKAPKQFLKHRSQGVIILLKTPQQLPLLSVRPKPLAMATRLYMTYIFKPSNPLSLFSLQHPTHTNVLSAPPESSKSQACV